MQNTKLKELANITLQNNAFLIVLTEHMIRLLEIAVADGKVSASPDFEASLAELRSVLSKSKAELPQTRKSFGLE